MKFTETSKFRYSIFSALAMMIAYMARMNSLIFIIATVMYLLIHLFDKFTQKTVKERIVNIIVIGMYITIAIMPSVLIKNYYLDKWNLDKDKSYPFVSYLLMSMEESYRENGWYNEQIAEFAIKEPEKAKSEYPDKIKNRLIYFSNNIGYACNFYVMKVASMWTENTYSTMFNTVGRTYSVMDYVNVIKSLTKNEHIDTFRVEDMEEPINFYQKVLLVLSCVCCLIFLIQNRKNVSLEVLFLLTIFIGGFMFHVLWEAKSRYIIPYVIVLMPIAVIDIKTRFKKEAE